ncbi:MAG: arylamine N-acetyltransferase [Burkholderiales bacterium]|nr:arylamine N-acetyltransferase [Burkholderiales bacterium]
MDRAQITDRYLDAIGLQRQAPTLGFLQEITRRHVASFAFCSVGPRLGDSLPLDLPSLFQRIVERRRGGYCFEQNGLLFEVLGELGFEVRLALARVIHNRDVHPGLTHRISLVQIDGRTLVTDVGFGPQGPRHPVPLTPEPSPQGDRVYRVAERHPGEYHLQLAKDGDWYSLYRFELSRYGQADCELGHFWSHRHPEANFVRNLVVSVIGDDEVHALRNREYTVSAGGVERTRPVADAVELRELLASIFGVVVHEDEAQRLFDGCC